MTKHLKNLYEDLIEQMMMEEVAGLDKDILETLQNISIEKQRMAILSILDKDRRLFMDIKKIVEKTPVSATEHIKDVVQLLRKYVEVGDFERKTMSEVQTPSEVINIMLDKLDGDVWSNPKLKFLDNSTGTGVFMAHVIQRLMSGLSEWEPNEEKRYKHIVEEMIYVSELQAKNVFLYLTAIDPKDEYAMNVYCGSFLDEGFDKHAKEVWGVESYNICIMNPPYNQMLDMAFIKKSYELCDVVLAVHPSTWLLDEKGIQKKFTSTKELVKNDLISIELFNGNGVFGISLFVPCVISYINKNLSHNGIKCLDRINKAELTYSSIDEINKFSNVTVYPQLKNKIKFAVSKTGSIWDNKGKFNGSFYVNLAQINGDRKQRNKIGVGMDKELLSDNFFTCVTKSVIVSNEPRQQPYGFKTTLEGSNFLNYIKTNFVRFCLAIYKNNGNLHRGELALIPWLDFTQEWTDEKLYKHFDLTQEEINFIEKVIPKYY